METCKINKCDLAGNALIGSILGTIQFNTSNEKFKERNKKIFEIINKLGKAAIELSEYYQSEKDGGVKSITAYDENWLTSQKGKLTIEFILKIKILESIGCDKYMTSECINQGNCYELFNHNEPE